VEQAEAQGFASAGGGCNPEECERWKHLPVQTWVHRRTGMTHSPVWMFSKPNWRKKDCRVESHSSFFVCRKFHIHCCTDECCRSVEDGLHTTNQNGANVCRISGRVLNQNGFVHDYNNEKKGAYCKRRRSAADPSLTGRKRDETSGGVTHNTRDWLMMKTAYSIVLDTLFSKLRCELDATERRAKMVALQSKITSYVKNSRKEGKMSSVVDFTTMAIQAGWFSSCDNYTRVANQQDPVFCARAIAPMLACLMKMLNALEGQEIFKCFPSFGVGVLYICQKGVLMFGVPVVPALPLLQWLVPYPSTSESFFRFLWKTFYVQTSPTQRNFLTRTQNAIKACIRKHIQTQQQAEWFRQSMATQTRELRETYGDLVEQNMEQNYH